MRVFLSIPQREELDEILTAHPEMEFVQLQITYADWEKSCDSVESLL